jgi:hypothetical protein
MNPKRCTRTAGKWLAGGVGLAAASYAAYIAAAFFRYGKAKPATGDDADALLDQFMPKYEIAGRHKIRIAAPADVTLAAAAEFDLNDSALVRGIFKTRELILRSESGYETPGAGLIQQMQSMGWGLLAERAGRELVMGCATKPWEANPVFRPLRPDEFAAFDEPDYVKIVWNLRADPVGSSRSIFRTETRAVATDSAARRKFRWYWSLLSPGIILVRIAMLPAIKAEAERRCAGTAFAGNEWTAQRS